MLRFTIRDLLWVTALIALGIGWFVDRRNVVQERDRAFEFNREQDLDLHLTEHFFLDMAEQDIDLENMRTWATERRAKRENRAAERETTRKKR